MDKNVKKIISEAFNELYAEMVNEADVDYSDIEAVQQRAAKTGRGISYQDVTSKNQDDFNVIINYLLALYKENPAENAKAKEAVQNAFAPGSKIKNEIGNYKGLRSNKNFDDAVSDAYVNVFLDNFDKNLSVYKTGTPGFGAMMINQMKQRTFDYAYRKDGGDAFGSKAGTFSMDQNKEEFGTQFASKEFEAEDGTTKTGRQIMKDVMTWLENQVGSGEFPVNEKHYIAFKGIMGGDSPQQIYDENPGVFGKAKDINIAFDRFINGKAAAEISDLISSIYNVKFNLANLDKFGLKQTSAQSPEWSDFSKVDEKFTEEMKAIQNELFGSLKSLGLEPKQFNSDKKITSIIDALRGGGKDSEADVIENLFDDLSVEKEKAKSKGKYGSRITPLPQSEKEDELATGFSGMFEGISEKDTNKLMERVIRRLSK
jgi:hypothetical protein